MKYVFLKRHDVLQGYYPFEKAQTANFMLQDLQEFLTTSGAKDLSHLHNSMGLSYENLHLSKKINSDTVLFWNSDYIKPRAKISFEKQEEEDAFYEARREYSKKRWADMPKIEMSWKNYEEIVHKRQEIMKEKLRYMIFSQNDLGYIELIGKNELSIQDLVDMKIEHEKYLKYQAAWEKYDAAKPNRSDVWRSPADDEYEVDWQKYYDE